MKGVGVIKCFQYLCFFSPQSAVVVGRGWGISHLRPIVIDWGRRAMIGGEGGGRETWNREEGREKIGGRRERDVEEGGKAGGDFKVIQNAGKGGNEGENVGSV